MLIAAIEALLTSTPPSMIPLSMCGTQLRSQGNQGCAMAWKPGKSNKAGETQQTYANMSLSMMAMGKFGIRS